MPSNTGLRPIWSDSELPTGFQMNFTFTPFASTLLIEHTGNRAAPGAWLMFAAVLGIIAALIVYRGARRSREL